MPSAYDRNDFVPPRDAGEIRAFTLALLAHGLLIAALTWGVNWKRSDQSVSFEAELWSNVTQEAAPALAPPPPPEPVVKTPEVQPPPAPDADIALEQEKKRKQLEQLKKAEALAEKEKEKALQAKEDLAKRKALEDTKKLEAKKQEAREQTSTAALDKQRRENIARTLGLAGASGADNATGSAQKSSGPSASYGGKVRAKVKPNIVFTDAIEGNASAEVEVRSSPTGTIMSQRLVKSSGNKAWDEAVIKAIIRTETMPRDVDGRVPSPMILEFRPRD